MLAEQQAKVKLITLLNVSGGRPAAKRKYGEDWHEIARRAKKGKSQAAAGTASKINGAAGKVSDSLSSVAATTEATAGEDVAAGGSQEDSYKLQYAAESSLLSLEALSAVKAGSWENATVTLPGIGKLAESTLKSKSSKRHRMPPVLPPRLKEKLDDYVASQDSTLPTELLNIVSNYEDLLYSRMDADNQHAFRATIALHAMNHVNKTRARILKNNEALAHTDGKDASERETRDQGFTRPKVLILLPMRNLAASWLKHLTEFSLASQVENNTRFQKDFNLPDGAIDKLAVDEKDLEGNSKYPRDHRETFQGNIDDTFRVGMKVTRKSIKLYSEFYQSDLIIASPLGLRTSIENQKSADFLSSIEIIVAERLDVMQMQNWEHVEFIFDQLNKIPKEAHGTDFSRVKPWYLEGQAAHLRQSILLSAYETPEIRSLYNKSLVNVAGRMRSEQSYDGVLSEIRSGVKQTFFRFEAAGIQAEDDARFDFFTAKTLPGLRKSAVASSHTLIFVPSYFDFVRLDAYMDKLDDVDYVALSEYSSNSEISRARTNFFNGKKAILLVTERFHFFRRYKLRGAKTVVFYAPPEHSAFYAEFLQYPFLTREVSHATRSKPDADGAEEVLEAAEVSCQTVFSKYDYLKLERIVGTTDARKMCKNEGGERFSFV